MANRLLRNIAVTIGAGLALGVGRKLTHRPTRRSTPNFHPILSRLEDIEGRVARFELAPPPRFDAPAPEEIEALGTLVSSQSEDIASLRQDIQRIEHHNASMAEAFGQKVALLEQQVPIHIETNVAARMTELEQRLRGEFQEIHHRTVDAFADTIEQRVVTRINSIENSLIEHSHSIVSLREKSLKTDEHLQRLLEAVEKLCIRAESKSQIALLAAEPPADLRERPLPQAPGDVPAPAETLHNPLPEPNFEVHAAPPPEPQPEFEPEYAPARNGTGEHSSRGTIKPMGMAILGLAILGLRLFR